jgi:hypothetical protein
MQVVVAVVDTPQELLALVAQAVVAQVVPLVVLTE